ncbi:MAG: sodium:alanine symporter family protein [Gemmatimonadota bacterium]|nr:sodium:alanine symporter family protein [Gemmatimonadota bacterium]
MNEVLGSLRGAVWGTPLILLLAGTGLYLTILLRGLQFRRLPHALSLALFQRDEPSGAGDISHFQALMTALGATVGTANIVGVAVALTAGGPGALFWMWVAGFVGMVTKYSEAVLGVRFRETDPRGEQCGGPMYYLENGVRWGRLGRSLGLVFALFAAIAAFGVGNGLQSQAIAEAVSNVIGLPRLGVGIVTAVVAGAVILGGIRSIGRFAGAVIPVMLVGYIGVAVWVLIQHADAVPGAFGAIFEGAFRGTAAGGGVAGYTIGQALRGGFARGLVSSESGLGTGGIAAAAARTREPVRQALISMTQTFIDTIVVCTLTGLVLLTSGVWTSGAEGATLAQLAFSTSLPGSVGNWFIAISLTCFAFTTILGWAYYGERNIQYLAGSRAVVPYRLAFLAAIVLSSTVQWDVAWMVSEVMYVLMAFPNLIGLVVLSGIVVRETRSYFNRSPGQPSKRR